MTLLIQRYLNQHVGRIRSRANQSKALLFTPPSLSREPEASPKSERKRKRAQVEAFQAPSEKRLRADDHDNRSSHQIETWRQTGSYPKDYFESGDTTWEDIRADTLERRLDFDRMAQPNLGRKKSAASLVSLRRQAAEANMNVPTETLDDKSLHYRSPAYEFDLETKGGSYMIESPEGICTSSELICQNLLTIAQAVPQDTLFRDDLFSETCRKMRGRNEARIVEDISPLLAPSAENLATYGATELKNLVFNVNERWGESIPITDTRPQPDRCVGFDGSAFTWPQRQRLKHCIGHFVPIEYISPFLATWKMYFPFFACEAKSGTGDLDVADKQNAHSMTMAVRGIVELFKLVNREDELHRRVLAFSMSHDASIVRIYGHYALVKNRVATFYRHPLREFSFTSQEGKDKWTAYQFTKNVYFEFMPKIHALICSAIDQITLDNGSRSSNPPPEFPLGEAFGIGADLDPEQDMAASAPASQTTTSSKRKRLTGNEVLKQQNEELARRLTERDENTLGGVVRMLQEELEQQRQENERQRQESKQEADELKDMLKQLIAAPSQKGTQE